MAMRPPNYQIQGVAPLAQKPGAVELLGDFAKSKALNAGLEAAFPGGGLAKEAADAVLPALFADGGKVPWWKQAADYAWGKGRSGEKARNYMQGKAEHKVEGGRMFGRRGAPLGRYTPGTPGTPAVAEVRGPDQYRSSYDFYQPKGDPNAWGTAEELGARIAAFEATPEEAAGYTQEVLQNPGDWGVETQAGEVITPAQAAVAGKPATRSRPEAQGSYDFAIPLGKVGKWDVGAEGFYDEYKGAKDQYGVGVTGRRPLDVNAMLGMAPLGRKSKGRSDYEGGEYKPREMGSRLSTSEVSRGRKKPSKAAMLKPYLDAGISMDQAEMLLANGVAPPPARKADGGPIPGMTPGPLGMSDMLAAGKGKDVSKVTYKKTGGKVSNQVEISYHAPLAPKSEGE